MVEVLDETARENSVLKAENVKLLESISLEKSRAERESQEREMDQVRVFYFY